MSFVHFYLNSLLVPSYFFLRLDGVLKMLMLLFFFFFWLCCPFEVLKIWLILVVRPLLMSVFFLFFMLVCHVVVEFVVCFVFVFCCCCCVKEGCGRIFPFSSFICSCCFHVVILLWIHLCLFLGVQWR